jgi:hypothetical protein
MTVISQTNNNTNSNSLLDILPNYSDTRIDRINELDIARRQAQQDIQRQFMKQYRHLKEKREDQRALMFRDKKHSIEDQMKQDVI